MLKAIAITLVVSVVLNVLAALHIRGMHQQADRLSTELTLARKARDDHATAAQACSDSVQAMQDAAEAQAKAGEAKREEAKAKAQTYYQRADSVLAKPAPVPGNACASAQVLVSDWIKDRQP